jgi:hypothetical protein
MATIDERLEALVTSVELLNADVHGMQDGLKALRDGLKALQEAQAKTQIMLAEITEDIGALARIARVHQDRLDDQQARIEKFEG